MYCQRGHISGQSLRDLSELLSSVGEATIEFSRPCKEAINSGASSNSERLLGSSSASRFVLRNLKLKSFLNAISGTITKLAQRGIKSSLSL